MKITFLLLAHQNPGVAKRLVDTLIAAGHTVAIHYDQNGSDADFEQLRTAYAGSDQVCFASRVRVAWGHWSIVAAAISGIDAIEAAGWNPDYVYLISGSDYPIRPAKELEAFLERNSGKDFIEGVPANTMIWVKGGPQKERYLYRHYVSWRDRRRLARSMMRFQRFLRLERAFVGGMEPFIGSQWWCLRWQTLREIMKTGRKPEVIKFFQSTLIPDELYFQTLVYNQVPRTEIFERSPTLYQFTDYMVPVVFCADKVDYLLRQPFFFARKMSPNRPELFDGLDACWRGERPALTVPDEAIGKITPEYEATRVAQRDGLAGVHVIGRKPLTWAENLEWVRKPYFAVLGTSALEMEFARKLLSESDPLLCHGQLFHEGKVEFARGEAPFALEMRNVSAPNFLADLIRGACDRQMGFLLREGHGWHITDLLFEQPTAKVLVVHGDPLIGFVESLGTTGLDETGNEVRIEPPALETVPPSILVDRFERYSTASAAHRAKLIGLVKNAQMKGVPLSWSWLVEVDLNLAAAPKILSRPAKSPASPVSTDEWVQATIERWRDWLHQVENCLGVPLGWKADDPIWKDFANELELQQAKRRLIIEVLKAGGHALTVHEAEVSAIRASEIAEAKGLVAPERAEQPRLTVAPT